MEEISHEVKLTTGEIANLWTQYMNDTMSICIIKYSLAKVTDKDIKRVLEFALQIAESHIEKIKNIFQQEKHPIPMGFTKEDVNLDAPPLFTDTFLIVYMHVMALHGMTGYAGAVGTSVREDIIDYYIECNKESMELYKQIVQVMLHKGIYSKPPRISPASQIDMVNEQYYLTGWFGKKRPLNAMEISGISYNMQKTVVKIVLELGFSQVCQSKELQKYLLRGKKLCKHQFKILSTILSENDLSSPTSWSSEVTDSTVSPFSDKLILFHIVTLISAAVGFLAAGLAISQRRDIAIEYARLMAEIGLYAEDGAQLMISKGWMEQPPLADDRMNLSANK
ncbi:DUF3231 family protein [Sutcliffiella deserti]|uniref:DUF3231 family protein n=1 Tax=Sutcliffiella deserti TaxID=2875501 RepID=UPI001CC1223C|nr:DUF3231 family protein [Sutcliffiella deserti]